MTSCEWETVWVHLISVASAPRRATAGLVSHVLLQGGDVSTSALTVTWVEVAPGARQALHAYAPEQVYVVARGTGRMGVDGEERVVVPGELVLVSGGAMHGIENRGSEPAVYVSAATPAFRVTDFYDDSRSSTSKS